MVPSKHFYCATLVTTDNENDKYLYKLSRSASEEGLLKFLKSSKALVGVPVKEVGFEILQKFLGLSRKGLLEAIREEEASSL
mgnify:CR=1 FL=1